MPKEKQIAGLMSGLIDSFVSRNNDYCGYWAIGMLLSHARQTSTEHICLRLYPFSSYEVMPITTTISLKYQSMLKAFFQKQDVPLGSLEKADVTIFFKPTIRPTGDDLGWHEFICNIDWTRADGKQGKLSRSGSCRSHNPALESRSARNHP